MHAWLIAIGIAVAIYVLLVLALILSDAVPGQAVRTHRRGDPATLDTIVRSARIRKEGGS